MSDEDALVHQEATDLLGPDPTALPGDELAATEGVPGELADAVAPATEGESSFSPPQPGATSPKPTVRVAERDKGLFETLNNPYILTFLAIAMVGLVVILRLQRPRAKAQAPTQAAAEESAASLFAPAPEASTEVAASGDGSGIEAFGFSSISEPAAETPSHEASSAFEFEAPADGAAEAEKPDIGRARGAMLSTIGAVTSTAAYETQTPTATGGLSMAELDRRLALLEQRLEEVIDAKDRLERQVSAQTEELRVQRAAIARTQRVLRTVVRPEDDQPSEPVLKS
jgi:hypothetical protein